MTVPTTIEQQAAPGPAQTEQIPERKRKVSRRMAEVVRLLVSGECTTQKAAADKAGMNASHVCEQLRKPHVAAYIEQETRVALARLQAPAAGRLAHLLGQAASEHVQKDVAIHLLNIAGHKPRNDTQVSVNVEIKAGYVIDISPPVPQARLAHD